MTLFYKRNIFVLLLYVLPFFLYANGPSDQIIQKAFQLKLHQSHQWKSLLHAISGKSKIDDSSFLLSYPHFTLKMELEETLRSFFADISLGDRHAICRYPARYQWLRDTLHLGRDIFPKPQCDQLGQYLTKAALKDLKLVLTSGDPSSPSSMMGHLFFKIVGDEKDHVKQEYAVSFFTVIDSMNVPLVIFQGLVTGMKGFFVLRPYTEQVGNYLKEENRNIREYALNIPHKEKRLIYLHFWELKDTNIKYFYTDFNCATIVYDMLSIGSTDLSATRHLWVTPQKVIKDAKKVGILGDKTFIPSNEQHIKQLLEALRKLKGTDMFDPSIYQDPYSIRKFKFSSDPKIRFLEKKLLEVYTEYNYINDDATKEAYLEAREKIMYSDTAEIEEIPYDQNDTERIYDTFGDIQVGLTYVVKQEKGYVAVDLLPASNTLYDDNRGEFGESDLRLMGLELLMNENTLKVERFDLYSMRSLLPWDDFIGDLSSSFELNYKNHYDRYLSEYKAYNISIGRGYTKKMNEDLSIYAMLNLGVGYSKERVYPYLFSEVGMIFYETEQTKSVLEYKCIYNQTASSTVYHDINFVQSLFLDEHYGLRFNFNNKRSKERSKTEYGLSLRYFF